MRGFNWETLVALVANIKTTEWRHHYNVENGIPPEHPRSGTTDDVEYFLKTLLVKILLYTRYPPFIYMILYSGLEEGHS